MKLTILGTSSMVPTKDRNVSAAALEYKGEVLLFDCGEGTQRQMNICGIKRTAVKKVFISHWHGDHTAGLVGLIQTMGNDAEIPTLEIFGPKGTTERMSHVMKSCIFEQKVNLKIHEHDLKEKTTICKTEDYTVEAAPLRHAAPCLGFRFVETSKRRVRMDALKKDGVPEGPHIKKLQDGKDILYKGKNYTAEKYTYLTKEKVLAYITDTAECSNITLLAEDANLLVIEATYSNAYDDKAKENKHLTAGNAAQLANKAGVKKAVLTHFSQRYKNSQEIEENARDYFDTIIAAEDFMRFTV